MTKQGMTVLVVDDVDANVAFASKVLARMGYRPVVANSGEEALEKFLAESPDMILMDVMMPGIGGLEATRRIRQVAGSRWLPILMVTALGREDEILEGLRAGADDYLVKPLSLPMLQAKVQTFQRIVELQQELFWRSEELSTYHRRAEEERRLGARLMEYMINREGLRDPALRYLVIPAWHFSGDLLAAAYSPGQCHHILLSDGMGHGLPAAMASLPLFDTFYTMTELGYGIGRIVEVMNSRLHAMMPQGTFAAVTLVSVNAVAGVIEVWNGGNPYPCLVSADGTIIKRWKSRHVPLGVLPPGEFTPELEEYSYKEKCQMFLWSDGLTEAENAEGEQFGAERAWAVLESIEPELRFDALIQALNEHRTATLLDDISVAMIAVPPPGIVEPHVQGASMECGSDGLRMSFHFEAQDMKYLDVAPTLSSVLERIAGTKEHAGQIFLILSELISNALDHGLLGLDSSLKTTADGFSVYGARRQTAMEALQSGYIDIDIEIMRRDNRKMVKIAVRDSGPGFDRSRGPHVPEDGVYGRGIELVRRLSYDMQYSDVGNDVVVYYVLG